MKKHEIIFTLSDTEQIIIKLEKNLEDINCCDESSIQLIMDKHTYLLSHDSISEQMYSLSHLLTEALANRLQLHESITKDIGYLYNEDLHWTFNEELSKRPPHLVHVQENNWWVGDKHNLWCHEYQSWIYNDAQNNIIFELTPLYPGLFDTEEKKYPVPFKEWMQNYKPFLMRTIPREVAQKWLEQANSILKTIEVNVH